MPDLLNTLQAAERCCLSKRTLEREYQERKRHEV